MSTAPTAPDGQQVSDEEQTDRERTVAGLLTDCESESVTRAM